MSRPKINNKWATRAKICGVTGLVVSIVFTLLFGWMMGVFGIVLGVLSVVFGILARKQTNRARGKNGVVMGIISIVFAAALMIILLLFPGKIGQLADEKGFPMIAKHARALQNGIVGMLIEMNADDDDPAVFLRELNEMKKSRANN